MQFQLGTVAFALLLLTACAEKPKESVSEKYEAEIERLERELADAKAGLPNLDAKTRVEKEAKQTPEPVKNEKPQGSGEPMHGDHGDDGSEGERISLERCWQDYCPCDTSDPDYGYGDVTICRNLRGGVSVDDGTMAIGAAGRDARRGLREYKEQYGDF